MIFRCDSFDVLVLHSVPKSRKLFMRAPVVLKHYKKCLSACDPSVGTLQSLLDLNWPFELAIARLDLHRFLNIQNDSIVDLLDCSQIRSLDLILEKKR